MTFCEDTTVKASYEGTILSSGLDTDEPMNCTLTLTGIPGNSWLKLWLTEGKKKNELKCPKKPKSDFNYISLAGGSRICSEKEEILYYFSAGFSFNTAELQFQTSMLENELQFNLNYRGNKHLNLKKVLYNDLFDKSYFF